MALQSHSKHWVQKPPEAGVRPQGSVSPNRPGPPHSSWLLLPLPWGSVVPTGRVAWNWTSRADMPMA